MKPNSSYVTITVDKISARRTVAAGQYTYDAVVTYHYGQNIKRCNRVQFISGVHGSPVLIVVGNEELPIQEWRRYGNTLNPDWVRRFHGSDIESANAS